MDVSGCALNSKVKNKKYKIRYDKALWISNSKFSIGYGLINILSKK
jgi:hypothetical protein